MKRGLLMLAGLLAGVAALSVGASGDATQARDGSWSAMGSMNVARAGAFATLLANGKVLVAGGAAKYETPGDGAATKVGYAVLAVNSGDTPYGTAVFSFKQNGVTVTEAGVPASPPTTSARIFIDYRTDVNAVPARSGAGAIDINTGIVAINYGSATANVTYTLRNMAGGAIKNVHVHHNFSYNSCGFFEVASYFGDRGKGLFKDSSLHNNVIVDSAWMGLLQVNNTDLENIHFYNNTLIQRPGSLNAGILWIIFTATSSGMEGGELVPGTVHLTNNLYVLHGISRPWNWLPLIDQAFDDNNNIVVSYSGPEDPNYVDLGFANIAGTAASDFDLVNADSPAVDAGADTAGNTLDYFNRARPNGSAPDIGAMEFGSFQAECIPRCHNISR